MKKNIQPETASLDAPVEQSHCIDNVTHQAKRKTAASQRTGKRKPARKGSRGRR